MGKVKIGLYVPHIAKGGAGRAVSRISKILNLIYDVHIILLSSETLDFEYAGKVINMDLPSVRENLIKKVFREIKRIRKLKKIKKQNELKLVISFLDIANIANIMTRTKKCKAIVSVRGSIIYNKADGRTAAIKNILLKKMYKKADKIIAVSKVIRSDIIDICKVEESKVVTIYNPYDIDEIEKLSREKIDSDTAKFIYGGKVIIAAGQFVFQKGFWHLLKAFKLVNMKHSDTKLLLCGVGHQQKKIENLVHDLGLTGSVKLLGFQQNLFKYLKISDVFVLSSVSEGFPNVLVEAMICENVVVAADCKSGPREILFEVPHLKKDVTCIQRADYGILTPALTPSENWQADYIETCDKYLADAIILSLSCEEVQSRFAKQGIQRASAFRNEICADNYCNVINNLL